MHTKGSAAKRLKSKLGLDLCIYLGNDLNDISMFSNALDDNDFIVIAKNEKPEITDMLLDYLKQECRIKGIEWNDARILVLDEGNVNNFLHRTSKILGVLNSGQKSKKEDMRTKYKVTVKKPNSKPINQVKRRKADGRFH